jgi:hypothetical protein
LADGFEKNAIAKFDGWIVLGRRLLADDIALQKLCLQTQVLNYVPVIAPRQARTVAWPSLLEKTVASLAPAPKLSCLRHIETVARSMRNC